jgi:hypothetical protein
MRQIQLVILTIALAAPTWAEEPPSTGLTLAEAHRLVRAHGARLATGRAHHSARARAFS